ncbi:hypothetical protein Tco_0826412 [Tanacetum coccineum]
MRRTLYRPVLTRNNCDPMVDMCMYALRAREILQFKRLDGMDVVPLPDNTKTLTLKGVIQNKHDEEETRSSKTKSRWWLSQPRSTQEVTRIFRYLRGTVNRSLVITKDLWFELTGFSDADLRVGRHFKSIPVGAQFLGEKLVSCPSKKQDCTAAVYRGKQKVSLSFAVAQVLWIGTQLTDLALTSTRFQSTVISKQPFSPISCNPVLTLRT